MHAVAAAAPNRIAVATVAIGVRQKQPWKHLALSNHRAFCARHGYHCALLRLPSINSSLWRNATPAHRRRHPAWLKFPLVDELLHSRGFDAVLTIDLDALVMNANVTVESLLARAPPRASVILTADTTLVQSAQVIYRRTPFTRRLLRELFGFPSIRNMEQGAFAAWLCGCRATDAAATLRRCYDSCDRGYRNEASARAQKLAAWHGESWAGAARRRAGADIAWLPMRSLNAYAPPGLCGPGQGFGVQQGGDDATTYRAGDFILHLPGTSNACRQAIVARALSADGLSSPPAPAGHDAQSWRRAAAEAITSWRGAASEALGSDLRLLPRLAQRVLAAGHRGLVGPSEGETWLTRRK